MTDQDATVIALRDALDKIVAHAKRHHPDDDSVPETTTGFHVADYDLQVALRVLSDPQAANAAEARIVERWRDLAERLSRRLHLMSPNPVERWEDCDRGLCAETHALLSDAKPDESASQRGEGTTASDLLRALNDTADAISELPK